MVSKQRICLISLGCAKNLVDSENVLGFLGQEQFLIVGKPEDADIAIVNTCAFIQEAVKESIDTIFELIEIKRSGKLKKVVVMGCFVQRYGYKLLREMPEVDVWLGTGNIDRIVSVLRKEKTQEPHILIGRPGYLADHESPRVQTTPFYMAYLKIAEGCSNKCTYCTIPRLRGHLRSRAPDSIIAEAQQMAYRGVREINLVAQDTTMYGRDLGREQGLEDLLERLTRVPNIDWIRVLYAHPQRISERLLELVTDDNSICPYLDLPLQHVSGKILEAMGREPAGESPWELIERIRSGAGAISLRTTLMVGFPGETEEDFHELCEFVRTARFDHLGAFVFSPEPGTRAAKMKNCVERQVAQERLDKIMALQAEISEKNNKVMIGQVVPVLIEGRSSETKLLLRGRTAGMAPEVDGQVLINKGQARVGEIARVLITEAYAYDLVGEIL
ncbi:MAG: 30S ribosomal protein S12 methylthiotransferase RimO [Deltaproteobacteria bacterium]|nr:30S ribosomal protein S12 methylthiotransferase RimO [Deltaproteobacteria bacterium]MBW2301043.1 30S ribosomal protein S12 methylthiotransferase RimO [Deltaproteobacteria bacterium]